SFQPSPPNSFSPSQISISGAGITGLRRGTRFTPAAPTGHGPLVAGEPAGGLSKGNRGSDCIRSGLLGRELGSGGGRPASCGQAQPVGHAHGGPCAPFARGG